MTARDWFTLALRVLGIWLVVQALMLLVAMLGQVVMIFAFGQAGGWSAGVSYFLLQTLASAIGLIVGMVLLFQAPRIARWFYRPVTDEPEAAPSLTIDTAGAYRIAAFLLGIYAWLQAVPPGVQSVVAMVRDSGFGGQAGQTIGGLIQAVLHVLIGAMLVFGSRRLAQFLARLRDDDGPDGPAAQFTLRLMLIIVVGTAIALGLIRWVTIPG